VGCGPRYYWQLATGVPPAFTIAACCTRQSVCALSFVSLSVAFVVDSVDWAVTGMLACWNSSRRWGGVIVASGSVPLTAPVIVDILRDLAHEAGVWKNVSKPSGL
jgi:hypothetical protein